MSELTARYLFAALCALGMLAIGVGAVLEIARFRRNARQADLTSGDNPATNNLAPLMPTGNVISLRQFRFRLLSAVIWMIVLGTLCYSITALWPERSSPQALQQVQRFVTVVGASLSLLLVAFALFVYDVIQLSRERRAQTARFYQGLAELARNEAAQLQERQRLQASTAENINTSAADATGAPALNSVAANTEPPAPTSDKTIR
jgi:hypothetical protein